ncbi:MAG: hypothetical protein ACYDAD_12625 [Acidimicrobiales bacterium]
MTQGNNSSMATLHASSSAGAFGKLATYAIQAAERLPLEATNLLVANSVDSVIHVAQAPPRGGGGGRCIASVREVVGADGPHVVSNEIFHPAPDGRAVPALACAPTPPTTSWRRLRPRALGPARRVEAEVTAVRLVCGLGVGVGLPLATAAWRGALPRSRPEPQHRRLPLVRMASRGRGGRRRRRSVGLAGRGAARRGFAFSAPQLTAA